MEEKNDISIENIIKTSCHSNLFRVIRDDTSITIDNKQNLIYNLCKCIELKGYGRCLNDDEIKIYNEINRIYFDEYDIEHWQNMLLYKNDAESQFGQTMYSDLWHEVDEIKKLYYSIFTELINVYCVFYKK